MTSYDTQLDSVKQIDKPKMYQGIMEVLMDTSPLIAEEIAKEMQKRGYRVEANRQGIQPRCTELVEKGMIEECGAALNQRTGKMNVRYQLTEEAMELRARPEKKVSG